MRHLSIRTPYTVYGSGVRFVEVKSRPKRYVDCDRAPLWAHLPYLLALTLALPFAGAPLPPPRALAPPPLIASDAAPPAPPLEFEQESALERSGEFEFELSETTREGEA